MFWDRRRASSSFAIARRPRAWDEIDCCKLGGHCGIKDSPLRNAYADFDIDKSWKLKLLRFGVAASACAGVISILGRQLRQALGWRLRLCPLEAITFAVISDQIPICILEHRKIPILNHPRVLHQRGLV